MKKLSLSLIVVIFAMLSACGAQQPTQPAAVQQIPAVNLQPASADFITGIVWQWGSLTETTSGAQTVVPDKDKYTLLFQPDGIYTARADCNLVTGKYSIDGANMTILPGSSTMKECGEGSLYSNYLNLLGNVTSFGMQEDQLVLVTGEGGAQMFFYNGGKPLEQAESAPSTAGIDVKSVTLDLKGLPYTTLATLAEATGYSNSGLGPKGLPEHVEVLFGAASPAEVLPTEPVIYIIPVEAYQQLWDANGDTAVTGTIAKLQSLLQEKPEFPTQGMPVLPFERAVGINDTVVQGAYLSTPTSDGLRFVGRFVQDGTASGLFYIYMGLSPNGKYLVVFFYPVTDANAPQPDLATLDGVIQSLNFSESQ